VTAEDEKKKSYAVGMHGSEKETRVSLVGRNKY